jgi:signal transduction histidine kinase/ligand-binding sensor domain-containing protein
LHPSRYFYFKLWRLLAAFLFFQLISLNAAAQQNILFTSYTVADGLSQSTINDIAQDRNGFLWIGTDNGLCRFDGYNFKTYKTDPTNANAINGEKHFHFYVDKDKRLWITSFSGLSIYSPEQDNFTNLVTYVPNDLIASKNHIFGEDKHYVWVGLNHYGIVRVDKITLKTTVINIPNSDDKTEHNSWYDGFLENGKLWIVAQRNFIIYNTITGSCQKTNIPVLGLVNVNDTIAAGFNESNAILIDKHTLKYKLVALTDKGVAPAVNSMYLAAKNELMFFSATKGVIYLDPVKAAVTANIAATGEGALSKTIIASCGFRDLSGNTWIGTAGDGLLKLTYPFKNFKLYRAADNKLNAIYSIYADSATIYASCGNAGLSIYSKKDGFIKNITINKNQSSIVNRGFIAPTFSAGKLLMIADNKSVGMPNMPFTYNKLTGQITALNNGVQDFYTRYWGQGIFRHFIVKNSDGSVLTNVGQYLAALKDDGKGGFTADTLRYFSADPISCFQDAKGRVWVGTFKGVYVFSNNTWTAVKLPGAIEIKTINEDNDGNIWLGSPVGIYMLNNKLQLSKIWNENNTLINQHLYGILRDNAGNMWFSHNKGLSEYKWKEKIFKHFSVDDGLQSAEFNGGAYFKAADGELFFGGINGITAFYPEQVNENLYAPAVQITGIQLFDNPYKTSTSYWNVRSITLPYTDNSLSFDLTLPEYTNPSKNTYAYRMDGIDKNWINSGNKRFARYAGLRPGHYFFKARAANNDGVWGKPSVITIEIVPPVWQRTWFIIMEILTGGAIIAISVLGIQKAIYRKKIRAFEMLQKIQSERERISRDLHDNIGTQLSLINKSIKDVTHPLSEMTIEEKNKRLDNAQLSSVEVIDTLRETIWALNVHEISLEGIADRLKGFIHKNSAACPTLETEFIEDEEQNQYFMLSPAEALNLYRICQEAITNTLKYANASALKISILVWNGKYKISIADDGVGFIPRHVDKGRHYGLENMKFRANEIACHLQIEADPGNGTVINIIKK